MLRIYVLLFVVVILHTEILVIAETMLILEKGFHHKNKKGFELILKNLKWRYEYGSEKNITDYDIIFSPSHPVDSS